MQRVAQGGEIAVHIQRRRQCDKTTRTAERGAGVLQQRDVGRMRRGERAKRANQYGKGERIDESMMMPGFGSGRVIAVYIQDSGEGVCNGKGVA